jgi:outer membrane immunogenic protein
MTTVGSSIWGSRMKKIVSAVTSFALMAPVAAIAADVPAVKSATPFSVQARHDWSGFYAGVNAGYETGAAQEELTQLGTTIFEESLKLRGGFAGGQMGLNQQIGNFVWGVEGDYQRSRQKGSLDVTIGGLTRSHELEVPWFATARLRAGWANGPSLLYLTGGGLWAEGKVKITQSGNEIANSGDKRRGWTIGAGYEAMLSPQWSWKLEYLYAKIRDKETQIFNATHTERVRDHILRLGVNYRFGG